MIKDRMERLAVLPFSVGCVSHSSIAAIQPKRHKDLPLSLPGEEEDSRICRDRMRNVSGLFPMPKTNISEGLHRLIKIIKTNFSQLIIFKEDEEEIELDMEIGNPTDVKHVTHIGWDGSATTNTTSKSWDDFRAAGFFNLSPVTLQQHGINLAAQADTNMINTYCTKQASDTIN